MTRPAHPHRHAPRYALRNHAPSSGSSIAVKQEAPLPRAAVWPCRALCSSALAEPPDHGVEDRRQEDAEQGHADHAGEDRRARGCGASRPRPRAAITSGNTPRMNANDVMMIGRSRTRAASTAASNRTRLPAAGRGRTRRSGWRSWRASPTSTTKPTCTKMFTSIPARAMPAESAQQAHRHDQDHRQRQRPALVQARQHEEDQHRPQHERAERVLLQVAERLDLARLLLQVAQLGPLGRSCCAAAPAASFSIVARTSPVLTPGSEAPLIAAAGNML